MKRIGFSLAMVLVLASGSEGRGGVVALTAHNSFLVAPEAFRFSSTRLPLFDPSAFPGQTLIDVQVSFTIAGVAIFDLSNLGPDPGAVTLGSAQQYSLFAERGVDFDVHGDPTRAFLLASGSAVGQQTYQLGPFEHDRVRPADVVSGTLNLGPDFRFIGTGDIVFIGLGSGELTDVAEPPGGRIQLYGKENLTYFDITLTYTIATPEPSTLVSAGIAGLMGLGCVLRRRKRLAA